jgi:hypothetical protein
MGKSRTLKQCEFLPVDEKVLLSLFGKWVLKSTKKENSVGILPCQARLWGISNNNTSWLGTQTRMLLSRSGSLRSLISTLVSESIHNPILWDLHKTDWGQPSIPGVKFTALHFGFGLLGLVSSWIPIGLLSFLLVFITPVNCKFEQDTNWAPDVSVTKEMW